MKITAILGAGALAIGSLVVTAAPAAAQRHGDGNYDRGHHDRDNYNRGHNDRGHHYGQRNHRRGYAYGYRSNVRSRVVCRVQRGYYGPVRRCYRIYR
ncbi:hypothetical protein [Sphingomonas oligophenolica]|uniref:Sulfur globule protein n=1 Tax=Sphingomonas oligophenolica TaxID=301154 RepID=A0A502CHC5_9SPHN|nr:hypothetical protein [Sphingomonas oligophenolica]TPG12112.1 hypothetical protein EAH84_10190 [Sphingomonas oligophenolica]